MSRTTKTSLSSSHRIVNHAVRTAIAAAVTSLAFSAQGRAANFFYQGAAAGPWDTTTANWATPLISSLPLTQWINGGSNVANFTSNESGIVVAAPISAGTLTFTQAGSDTFTGSSTLTVSTINNQVGSQGINFYNPVASPGQLVINGVTYPNANGKGVSFFADSNLFPGGILLTGGSVYLNLGPISAKRFLVDPTHLGGLNGSAFSSPTGFNGADGLPSSVQSGPILMTSVSGTSNSFWPTITVDGNGSTVGLASIHTNDYVLPNPILLNPSNPSNAANFYTAVGAGSVADSGTVSNGPYPAYATINFAGQISGNGSVLISNDFYGGGGKGFTIFSNTGNSYTGKTIINNNGQNFLTFQVGAKGAIPATSDLVFGGYSLGQSISTPGISSKQVGAFDLNGFDVTVKSLSTDMPNNLQVAGITSVNNAGLDPNLTSGPHAAATDSTHTSTLTIDSAGSLNNTFFGGNIEDGTDFLIQDNATGGNYFGTYKGAAGNYLQTTNGLTVALKLAPTNAGVLTLKSQNGNGGSSGTGGPLVAYYGYSGGTTIAGGSLYVAGTLAAASGSTSSQVLLTTPIALHTALLGGTGTINPDIHLQSGTILAPGSAPAPLAVGSGTSFNALPTTFNIGTLTVNNLTMDGGSQFNFVVNNGSNSAVAGSGYGNLTFAGTGTFTNNASAGNPIYVHPSGTFAGFSNYTTSAWTLVANFPVGSNLSNITLDTRNGYTPLPLSLLGGGTFNVTTTLGSGSSLSLIFIPSGNVTAYQYSGPASGTWNTNATNTVWTDLIHGAGTTFYADPGNVLFATPAAPTTITVDSAGVSPASVNFTNAASASYTLTGGSINGAAPLSLNGAGRVILTAANAYSGGTGISAGGTIESQIGGALGSGDLSIYNGTWNTTTADQAFTLNVQVFGSSAVVPTTTSTIQTGPTAGPASGNLTITGNIYGSGSLTKTGMGNLTIIGNLTQGGDLNVTSGNLVIQGIPAYAGTTNVAAGAGIEYQTTAGSQIAFQASALLNGNLTFDNLSTITFSPGVSAGTGKLILKTSGSLVQGTGGTGAGGTPVTISSQIVLNPANTPNFYVYIGMAGNGNQLNLVGPITGNGDVYFGAGIGQGGGAGIGLASSASSYTGNTYLTTGATSVMTLNGNNVLPATTQFIFGNSHSGGGSVNLNHHSLTVAGIQTDPSGGGFGYLGDNVGGGSLTVDGGVSGQFNALLQGRFNLNVALTNNAVLTLSWNGDNSSLVGVNSSGNIFGGITTISGGVLRFSNPSAFSPNQFTVLNGGVLEIHAHGWQVPVFNPTGAFNNNLSDGTDLAFGADEVQVAGGASGFSAFGADPAVFNFGGTGSVAAGGAAGPTVVWGSTYFNPSTLVLNQTSATNTLDLQNAINLNGASRTVAVNSTLAGTTATISGAVLGNGGLIKTGPGALQLTGSNTYNGSTSINAGSLIIGATGALPAGSPVVNNGAFIVNANSISGLISGNGTLNIGAGPGPALLQVTAGGGGGGTNHLAAIAMGDGSHLDLTNNNLIVVSGANVPALIKQAANLGAWNGPTGITSSSAFAAAATSTATALAYATGTEFTAATGQTTFAGQSFNPTDTLVKYTLAGDANMDGSVTFADFLALQNDYNKPGDWAQGDWNYDGQVTFADFLILQNNYNKTLSAGPLVPASATSPAPEPTALAVLLLGTAAGIARRRHRSRS